MKALRGLDGVEDLVRSAGGGFFFFSSRRRHTRCSRDWSSDVCSSDLARGQGTRVRVTCNRALRLMRRLAASLSWPVPRTPLEYRERESYDQPRVSGGSSRSEERRVGKEWSFPWSADSEEKKICDKHNY